MLGRALEQPQDGLLLGAQPAGRFALGQATIAAIRRDFDAGRADEAETAREMRDTIREAARDVHNRSGASATSGAESSTGERPQAPPRPGATVKLNREDAILEILAAVKDGRLEPDEADVWIGDQLASAQPRGST